MFAWLSGVCHKLLFMSGIGHCQRNSHAPAPVSNLKISTLSRITQLHRFPLPLLLLFLAEAALSKCVVTCRHFRLSILWHLPQATTEAATTSGTTATDSCLSMLLLFMCFACTINVFVLKWRAIKNYQI